MKRFLNRAVILSGLALAGLGAVAYAQEAGEYSQPVDQAEKERRITVLLTDTLYASRMPEIYNDLRSSLRRIYLPYMKDQLERGDLGEFDPQLPKRLALVIPIIEYSLKAADELAPVLEREQDAIIRDMAELMARSMTVEQIRLVTEMVNTPAARKAFDTLYAVSRLMTAYTLEDVRGSQAMTEWMKELEFDSENNPFSNENAPPPPPERVLRAEAVVADLMRISRVEEMVADVTRFTREVVLQVETLDAEERLRIRQGLQRFEFFYNLGKSMALAVAPSTLAGALNDGQLEQFHEIVLSPVMAKSFRLMHDVVGHATSFTRLDIRQMRELSEEAETFESSLTPEEERQLEAEWEALVERWRERLENSLSPETRAGLERSTEAFQAFIEQEQRREERLRPDDELPAGQREL